jgi:hypothetical protein
MAMRVGDMIAWKESTLAYLSPDFADMLDCLIQANVEFILVGAFAMAHFGYVRATGDIDLWINPTLSNSHKVFAALGQFGAPLFGISPDYFAKSGHFLQLGVPPNRIDIITAIDGVNFDLAFAEAENGQLGAHKLSVLSLRHLIVNKESTGRAKDKPDVDELKKLSDMYAESSLKLGGFEK